VGSPRLHSTSESLARYLTEGLAARGWQTDIQHIAPALRQPERWAKLEQQFLAADVIALCFPLYVDSLPAETTLAL
jgi:NAD(P)H-dependent FMN reductase